MLLVVVDQAGVRRRSDDAVVRPPELELTRVAMEHDRRPLRIAHVREVLDPRCGVEQVAGQELVRALDRPAHPAMLVAPVLARLRRARKVEVEVGRQPSRARRASEHDPQHVLARVLRDQRAEVEQLRRCLRREPLAAKPVGRSVDAASRSPTSRTSASSDVEVVLAGLDRDQERVERCDIDADGVVAGLEGLHERRPRAGEGVEHASARTHVALEQRLDQLRHELAEVRVQPVDVLRPLALGELLLRPREREVDVAVELRLREGHGYAFAARTAAPRWVRARGRRRLPAPREARARRRRCRAAAAAARRVRAPAPRRVAREAAPAARAREPA